MRTQFSCNGWPHHYISYTKSQLVPQLQSQMISWMKSRGLYISPSRRTCFIMLVYTSTRSPSCSFSEHSTTISNAKEFCGGVYLPLRSARYSFLLVYWIIAVSLAPCWMSNVSSPRLPLTYPRLTTCSDLSRRFSAAILHGAGRYFRCLEYANSCQHSLISRVY